MRWEFNEAVRHHPKLEEHTQMLLRPAIAEATRCVKQLFNEVARNTATSQGYKDFKRFAEFFQSKNTDRMRDAIARLPVEEAGEFARTFHDIDRDIEIIRRETEKSPRPKSAAPPKVHPPQRRPDQQTPKPPGQKRQHPPEQKKKPYSGPPGKKYGGPGRN